MDSEEIESHNNLLRTSLFLHTETKTSVQYKITILILNMEGGQFFIGFCLFVCFRFQHYFGHILVGDPPNWLSLITN